MAVQIHLAVSHQKQQALRYHKKIQEIHKFMVKSKPYTPPKVLPYEVVFRGKRPLLKKKLAGRTWSPQMLIELAIALAKAKQKFTGKRQTLRTNLVLSATGFHHSMKNPDMFCVLILMVCQVSANKILLIRSVYPSSGINFFMNHVWNHTTPPNRQGSLAWPQRPCVNCLVRLVTAALLPGSAQYDRKWCQHGRQGETRLRKAVGFLFSGLSVASFHCGKHMLAL